jgi:hypothetical protein
MTEAIYLLFNLTCFSLILWNALSFRREEPLEKLKMAGLYFLIHLGFYLSFYTQKSVATKFFNWKLLLFSHWFLLFLVLLGIGIFFLVRKSIVPFWMYISPFLSFFIFFIFFGMETFHFFGKEFGSLSFLKAQNPLIGISFIGLYWIPFWKIRLPLFFVFLIAIGVYTERLKSELLEKLDDPFHYRYLPPERFFSGHALLQEELHGVYHFLRPIELEEPIYKFTMKPLRKLAWKDRLFIQETVNHLEFPILIKEEGIVSIYEMSRSFQGNTFRAMYIIETGEARIEGPLF